MFSHIIDAAVDTIPPDVRAAAATSPLGGAVLRALGERHTPGIAYVSGRALLARDPQWYEEIQHITAREQHLLTKTRAELEPAAQDGRVTLAVDTSRGDACTYPQGFVVGCIALWELGTDAHDQAWYELGTFTVVPAYRFKSGTQRAMPIADALYRRLLGAHRDKNILGTTTNPSAVHIGMRHGMQMISYDALPTGVAPLTCICPSDKTGVQDNTHCQLRDRACRVRVSFPTWQRLGHPPRKLYP